MKRALLIKIRRFGHEIYKNTEAKVDKTNQRIEMIVSEQKQLEDQMNESFTKVEQNITSVVTSVQSSGGSNLIRNSAMYFKESGKPTHWGGI